MGRESSNNVYVFALMSAASLAGYLGFSVAVDAFLAAAHAMLSKVAELAL